MKCATNYGATARRGEVTLFNLASIKLDEEKTAGRNNSISELEVFRPLLPLRKDIAPQNKHHHLLL